VEQILNEESGLKALAGRGGDMRLLEEAARVGDEAADLALRVYLHRLAAAVAAMAAALGGLDVLAFTGGIGENSAFVREELCGRLAFLGLAIDRERNVSPQLDADVGSDGSRVRVLVIEAREELVAARAARKLLADR
jgi:acetate kinase